MQTITLTLPKPHGAQATVIESARRFNVVNCGRRWGKTLLGVNRVATPQTLGYPVGWFSPTYKMLLEVWRESNVLLKSIVKRRSVQERRLEFITNGVLEFWSLDNPDAARGRKYRRVIVDEAAMVPGLMDAWQHVIRPTLVDYQGDGWFLSTPKGRNGYWQMYQWGVDDAMPEWAAWTMPTSANPFIPDGEIEAMRASMPENVYRQEILAEFIDDAGGVFRRVRDAATATPQSAAVAGHQYVMGVDWGRQNDFTVIAVIDLADNALVYLDRFTQIDYEIQAGRLHAAYNRFKPSVILAEYNSMGAPIVEKLSAAGFPVQGFQTTNKTKEVVVRALEYAFENGEICIIDDPILIAELQAYEQQQLPAGAWKFGAPDGMHDDTVIALALAWHATRPAITTMPNPFYD